MHLTNNGSTLLYFIPLYSLGEGLIYRVSTHRYTILSFNVFQREYATSYHIMHFVNDLIRVDLNYLYKKVTFNYLYYDIPS